MNKKTDSEKEISEEMKELVITRIDVQTPSNLKLSIGPYCLTKEEMIEHVRKGDDIGRQIVKTHISFLKALASGEFVRAITSVECR